MTVLFVVVDVVCLLLVISGIYQSQSRWAGFGYAVLGGVIPLALGAIAMFLLVPRSGSVMEVNPVLDTIGSGITLATPIGAAIGTMKARKRPKAQ